jgi:hypothetical protein
MANRREFIAAASGAGLASMGGLGAAGSETEDTSNGRRDLYELRRYVIDHEPPWLRPGSGWIRSRWEHLQRSQETPGDNQVRVIHLEASHGRTADRIQVEDMESWVVGPGKVVRP